MFEGLFETISSGLLWAAGIALVGALLYWAYNTYINPDNKNKPAEGPDLQRQRALNAPTRERVLTISRDTPVAAAKEMAAIDDKRQLQMKAVLESIPNTQMVVGDETVAQTLNAIKTGQADRYEFMRHTNYKNLSAIAVDLPTAQAYFPEMKQAEFDVFQKTIRTAAAKYPEGKMPENELFEQLKRNMTAEHSKALLAGGVIPVTSQGVTVDVPPRERVESVPLPEPVPAAGVMVAPAASAATPVPVSGSAANIELEAAQAASQARNAGVAEDCTGKKLGPFGVAGVCAPVEDRTLPSR